MKHKKTRRNRKMSLHPTNKTIRQSAINKLLQKKDRFACFTNIKPFEQDYQRQLTQQGKNGKPIRIQKEIHKILTKKFVPKSVLPNNDFYTYINNEWITQVDRSEFQDEKYIVQYDDFRILQNRVYYQLIDIVKDYIHTHPGGKKTHQIENVYKAGKRLLDDGQARAHLKRYVDFLDQCRTDAKPWYFLGIMNKNEIVSSGLPFVMALNPDEKEPTIGRIYMSQPGFTLVDFNVYIEDGTDLAYKAQYKRRYMNYINDMFTAFYGKHHGFKPDDVFQCEMEIIDAMICNTVPDDPYVAVTGKQATEYGLDWNEFATAFGFTPEKVPRFFIVNNINYLHCGAKMVVDGWNTDAWRTYYIYIYMRQLIRFHKTWNVISYEFCGKFMRGQEHMFPQDLFCVFNLAYSFNTFLTNEYIRLYADVSAIRYLQVLAEDLRIVYKRIIERNTWLQPETKRQALLKLDHFSFEIGSPPQLREDPLLDYTVDDVWENFAKINEWRSKRLALAEGKPNEDIPVIDWMEQPFKLTGSQAYVVNAYYTPTQNKIYIPIAYIQKPFIDMEERGIEYNLSTIGFTIGHEMSHSLDDSGSRYDHTGKLHNWWTKKDAAIFKKKQNDVIREYEEFAKRDGIDFDASNSIGEDLADISGLAICLEYLKDFLEKNRSVIPIRVLSFKAFLIYFAFQFKQKISKKAINAQIRTNPHPLDKYRTNVPLSRIEIFRDMYDVKKGDGMWWHNTDTIW